MENRESLLLFLKAVEFASEKHNGQLDKSGTSYFFHCVTVMKNVERLIPNDEDLCTIKTIALLHDVIEDTDVTYDDLRSEFNTPIADHVVLLTKSKGQDYFDYIDRLKYNYICRTIKKADLLHNMDLGRLDKITIKDIRRNKKYLNAFEILLKVEEELK